jgi:protoporphyrinogen oxidase
VRAGRVEGVELQSGERIASDRVISTMPLTRMVMQLDGAPEAVREACGRLRFRNTILVYLEALDHNPFPDNWIYVHSPELEVGRVTNFRNWSPGICGESPHSILCLEYWCDAEDAMWQWDDESIGELAVREIVRSGLVGGPEVIGRRHVLRIPRSYPVYRRGYRDHLAVIRAYLDGIAGLQVIGRYGAFKYNNQDHSILMGILAAENILRDRGHDLWGVNTDYDEYQEACEITETGLALV